MRFNNITVLAVIITCLFGSPLFAREKQKLSKEQLQKLEESWKQFSEETPRLKETPNVNKKDVDACVEKAINFLLSKQRPSGCWGAPTKTKKVNIYSPMPNSHISYIMGTTGLCVSSLCEWENKAPKSVRDKITPAIEKGQAWMIENLPTFRRSSYETTLNNWGHIYALSALSRLYVRAEKADNKQLQKQLVLLMQEQVANLVRYENIHGGWAYYDYDSPSTRPNFVSMSFNTAAGLVSLYEVSELKIDKDILPEGKIAIPESLVSRAVASLTSQQKPDFSYTYSTSHIGRPMYGINRASGSLGRTQACNAALFYWSTLRTDQQIQDAKDGKKVPDTALPYSRFVSQQVLLDSLDRFVARIGWLDGARKHSVPHDHFNKIAGYFYYFGHLYASQELLELESKAEQKRIAAHLTSILMGVQDKDGSYWDFVMYDYGQPWGTSMALISLARCYEFVK
jgi:hypothetical protein